MRRFAHCGAVTASYVWAEMKQRLSRMAMGRAVALTFIFAAVAACGSPPVVNGWPIGAAVDCGGDRASGCRRMISAATETLDQGDPGHPAIASVELHDEAPAVDALGHPILMTRSLILHVARFVLADGSVRAIGVADWPSGPVTVPTGP